MPISFFLLTSSLGDGEVGLIVCPTNAVADNAFRAALAQREALACGKILHLPELSRPTSGRAGFAWPSGSPSSPESEVARRAAHAGHGR